MKKTTLALTLICALLLSTVAGRFFLNTSSAQSSEAITIKASGNVEGTEQLQRNGNVYTLTGNISGGIQVQKSNIIIDGAGYTVQGNGNSAGIDLWSRRSDPSRPEIYNVTIKNTRIINFNHGIDGQNSHNNSFIGNYITDCSVAIWLFGSENNTISLNAFHDNNEGIHLDYSGKNNAITENNLLNNNIDIYVFLSQQPIVDRNWWSNYTIRYPNAKEIGNTGVWDTPYTFWENMVDNHPQMKPIVIPLYEKPADTPTIYINPDGSIEGTDKIQRDGNVYTLTENISSIIYVQRSNIVIDGAGFAINVDGRGIDLQHWVWVGQNPSNLLHNVTIQNLFMANGSVVANGGGNHTFYNNYIERIYLYGCSYNKIIHCTLGGINMDYGSNNNIVTENNLRDAVEYLSSNNTVDRNYWSNYLTKYPNATEIGNTGIGNQPYVYWVVETKPPIIYQDEHPLMEPVAIPLTATPTAESLPITLVIASTVLVAVVAVGLLVYLKKRRRE